MNKKNKITFWGVRGSFPTPDKDKMDFGGHTSCVSIETQEEIIIMDMGTGMKNLGESIVSNPNSPLKINIILSHYHWDHLIGFPMFAPLFSDKYQINIYGKKDRIGVKDVINHMLDPIFWPVSFDDFKADLNFYAIENNQIKISDNMIIKSQIHHHPNEAFSYKVLSDDKIISYITDCEHISGNINEKLINFAKNSDLLIHDSHFTKEDLLNHEGWGHSSWVQAILMAQKSKSKQLALYHYSPDYNDAKIKLIESDAKKIFKQTIAAKQGLVIYL
tara:strand:+ start:344 stop:1168 length:825 start_codon:yes stop_codon:yes gene_type:complete